MNMNTRILNSHMHSESECYSSNENYGLLTMPMQRDV